MSSPARELTSLFRRQEVAPGDICTLVGWSHGKQTILKRFMENKTPIKFTIPENKKLAVTTGHLSQRRSFTLRQGFRLRTGIWGKKIDFSFLP
jgi:hypothetical protein